MAQMYQSVDPQTHNPLMHLWFICFPIWVYWEQSDATCWSSPHPARKDCCSASPSLPPPHEEVHDLEAS